MGREGSTEERVRDKKDAGVMGARVGDGPVEAMDERAFFTSFYEANVRGRADDRSTIGGVTNAESPVRSLADWVRVASDAGLEVVDVVRSDRDPALTTPENDVLVLEKRGS
jgi:hypothetical protein